jgi:leucyl aminopeptidase
MQFVGTTARPEDTDVDLLCVPVLRDGDELSDLPGLDAATGGEIARARTQGEFRSKAYEIFVTPVTGPGWKARRIALVGAGRQAEVDAERIRRVAAICGYLGRRHTAASVGVVLRSALEGPNAAQHVADGLSAAELEMAFYKTDGDAPRPYPGRWVIVAPGARQGEIDAAVQRGRIIGQAANFARTLAHEPSNLLPPRVFADRVAEAAGAAGLAVEILDENRIKALNMRLLLSVSQGSVEPPRLVVLRHAPAGAPKTPEIALVGKGVTFDTGGISIKPADGMERMKGDMSGGAAVAGAMTAIARLGSKRHVIAVIPMVENMPSGQASRPGDVVHGASGKAVEIINTDAEGRLILADALWYARELGAPRLVDVATLTGAMMVALGRTTSGLFGQPRAWVDTVLAAATRAGDRFWPMPIYEEARDQIRSEIADIVNSAGRYGGAVTAAAFLREFAGDVPWAHLDIAGTAWAESKEPYQPKGSTGVAVRVLTELGMTAGESAPGSAG